MQLLSQIVGILLVVAGCTGAWLVIRGSRLTLRKIAGAVALASVCLLGGGLLIMQERVTRLSISKLGSIEANAQKAATDAKAISDLRVRVESQSATVDLVAKDAADARRSVGIAEQKSAEAAAKVSELDRSIAELARKVDAAREETDFSLLVARVSRDDRASFDRLLAITDSPNHPRQSAAAGAIRSIVSDPMLGGIGGELEWKALGVDPSSGSIAELVTALSGKLGPMAMPRLIDSIWALDRFSKYERLGFLVDLIRESPSIGAMHRACMLINTEAHLEKNVVGYREYLAWWDKNSMRYKADAVHK